MKRFAWAVLVTASVCGSIAGCDKPKELPPPEKASPSPSGAPTSAASAPSTPPSAAPSTGKKELVWEAPASFQSVPSTSSMRKATYKIAKAKGDTEDGELSVISAGGGLEPNIQRWVGQFVEKPAPKRSTKKVGELTVTLVELDGTFAGGGMPGAAPAGPKTKWKMLAAIVEQGEETTFFKLTGPEATVSAARKDFDTFVGSFKVK